MGAIFTANGMPYPTEADNDRKHGAQAMYELMKSGDLEIDPTCDGRSMKPKGIGLIEVIPMVTTEEDDPEEIEKFDGDDAWDAARYLIKSRMRPGKKPVSEVVHEKVLAFAKVRGKDIEEMDPNTIHMLNRRASAAEQLRRGRHRGGLGRIWRPRTAGGVA
jgi:hypothetical protein